MKILLYTLTFILIFSCASKDKVDLYNINDELNDKLVKGKNLFEKEKYTRSLDSFNYIIVNDRGSEIGLEARFYHAEASFELKDFSEAINSYEKYLQYSMNDERTQYVKYKICKSFFNLSTKHNRDQSNNDNAKTKIQFFIDEYPGTAFLEESTEMLDILRKRKAEKVYEIGKLYLKIREYDSAILYFNDVMKDYYDTIYSDESIISLIFLHLIKGDNEAATIVYSTNQENFLYQEKKIEAKELIDSYHLPLSWFKNFSRLYL